VIIVEKKALEIFLCLDDVSNSGPSFSSKAIKGYMLTRTFWLSKIQTKIINYPVEEMSV